MGELDQAPKETPPDGRWVFLKDLLPVDFWIGSQYKGNYAQRLQVDLPGVESICRAGDLPPIILRSDTWNPPSVNTPETVAPGLSAFKKTSFAKDPNLPESEKEYYRLSATDIKQELRTTDQAIPVGWVIHIKDRKILYDYQYKHPNASPSQTERYFINELDTILRNAFTDIALKETVSVRNLNTLDRHLHVGRNGLMQLIASLAGPQVRLRSLAQFVVTQTASTVFWQAAYKSIDIAFGKILKNRLKTRGIDMNYFPKGSDKQATYFWRLRNFSEREHQEYATEKIKDKFASAILPGGLFFENLYLMGAAMFKHKTPIVRLIPQQNSLNTLL